jgi:hypothetical protein
LKNEGPAAEPGLDIDDDTDLLGKYNVKVGGKPKTAAKPK